MSFKVKYAAVLVGFASVSYSVLWAAAIVEAWDFSDMPKAAVLFVLGIVCMAIGGAFRCEGEDKPRHAVRIEPQRTKGRKGYTNTTPNAKRAKTAKERATDTTARRGGARHGKF